MLSAVLSTSKENGYSRRGFKEDFLEEVILYLSLQRFSERQREVGIEREEVAMWIMS